MIEDFSKADFGPKMLALGERERKFVWHYVLNGGNGSQAARDAGYSDASEACKVRAHELLHRERVLDAVQEMGRNSFRSLLIPVIAATRALVDNPKHQDHAKTLGSVLSRLGLSERTAVDVNHTGSVEVNHTDDALETLRVLRGLGVPREKLVETFGFSGLERYEKMLAEVDARAPKLIEGQVIDG